MANDTEITVIAGTEQQLNTRVPVPDVLRVANRVIDTNIDIFDGLDGKKDGVISRETIVALQGFGVFHDIDAQKLPAHFTVNRGAISQLMVDAVGKAQEEGHDGKASFKAFARALEESGVNFNQLVIPATPPKTPAIKREITVTIKQ